MRPNETADIRKSIDKLQQALEILGDRYRDLRRERKQLRERIDELVQERDSADAATSAQLEMAVRDRKRVLELESRVGDAERRHEESFNRMAELESTIRDREGLIAEQEDTLAELRKELAARREAEEKNWSQEEQSHKEVLSLRHELASAKAENERLLGEMSRIEPRDEGELSVMGAEMERLRGESQSLQQAVNRLQGERATLEGKHLQAIGKLDAATRAEAMARTEVAALISEKQRMEDLLADLDQNRVRLEEQLRQGESVRTKSAEQEEEVESLRDELARLREEHRRTTEDLDGVRAALVPARERIELREGELESLHATIRQLDAEHAVELAGMRERLNAAELERENVDRRLVELQHEREESRATIDGLREQIRQAGASDDDRVKAGQAKIDALGNDLAEALDMAARKEMEAVDAERELERLRMRVGEMSDELERLREAGAATTNGAAEGHSMLSDEERRAMAEQIDSAIRLIDRHLEGKE
ncbi:MAG: hypothetical protein ABIR47_00260 [Candidatus Kapaibacterium sp.]